MKAPDNQHRDPPTDERRESTPEVTVESDDPDTAVIVSRTTTPEIPRWKLEQLLAVTSGRDRGKR